MALGDIVSKARSLVKRRGGVEALKEDAQELKEVATGGGGAVEKAKDAAEALKDPGAPGQDPTRTDRA